MHKASTYRIGTICMIVITTLFTLSPVHADEAKDQARKERAEAEAHRQTRYKNMEELPKFITKEKEGKAPKKWFEAKKTEDPAWRAQYEVTLDTASHLITITYTAALDYGPFANVYEAPFYKIYWETKASGKEISNMSLEAKLDKSGHILHAINPKDKTDNVSKEWSTVEEGKRYNQWQKTTDELIAEAIEFYKSK